MDFTTATSLSSDRKTTAGNTTNDFMSHHQTEPETDTIPRNGTIKLPVGKIAMLIGLAVAGLTLWSLVIPSKAEVSKNAEDIKALALVVSSDASKSALDHDAIVRMEVNLDIIRRWVDQQKPAK